jgi:hypothetical protein
MVGDDTAAGVCCKRRILRRHVHVQVSLRQVRVPFRQRGYGSTCSRSLRTPCAPTPQDAKAARRTLAFLSKSGLPLGTPDAVT